MTNPLQTSVSDRERTIIYQTYASELIAVIHQQKERVSPSTSSPFNDLAPGKNEEWTTKSHIMLLNYLLDHINLLRQNRKRMQESCTIHGSYLALEMTEINDTTSIEQSPRKILFAYDCESIPLYENQEVCIRDYAEREAYWDIPTAMSPESFVRGAVPEQSTSYSDARVSSSAETIDLMTPDLIQGTPTNAACYAPKKRKLQFREFK